MKVGSIVLWRDAKFGHNRAWTVEAICLGAEGQEGLIRLRSMFEKPGVDELGQRYETVMVPEVLLRGVEVFEPREAVAA